MAISENAKQITEHIYKAYGTDSGVLFGIPPEHRSVVEAIVQCVLDIVSESEE